MSFFDPPKFPEPFKPEPLWQMNTCPTCQNDLVCHDQGECLRRPTPETDAQAGFHDLDTAVPADFARRLERERNEARHKLEIAMAANSDVERIAKERNEAQKAFAIATDQLVQVQGELRQAREELEKWETELSAVMPPDFKDWFQNDKSEWPEVARRVIESLREREDFFMKTFEQNDTELRQAREELERLRKELE